MKNRLLLASILLLSLLCSGCWNINEINTQSIILAMGFDPAPENKIKVSVEIPIAEMMLAPITGGGAADKSFFVISQEAENAFSAAAALQNKTSKSAFGGQLKVLVINTAIAERGLLEFMDFIQRHPEIPPLMVIVLAKSQAEGILKATLSSKEIPAFAIHDYLLSPDKYNIAYSLRAWQIVRTIATDSEDVFIPFIDYDQGEQSFNIHGLGVFHHGRLVGELSDVETSMFGLMTGRARNVYPSLPFDDIGRGTYRGVTARSQIRVESGDNPKSNQPITFLVKVRARGFLVELTSGKAQFTTKVIKEMEKKTEDALRNEMIKTLRHLQELNADILSFGELLRATRPKVWNQINWDEEYQRARVKVDVKFKIERTGIYR